MTTPVDGNQGSTRVGDRIVCIYCNDRFTPIEPGTFGTVTVIDDAGTVHVDWDNGRRLGLVYSDGDRWGIEAPNPLLVGQPAHKQMPNAPAPTACPCMSCLAEAGVQVWWMVVCDLCGNKRCPHAANHLNDCTRSNEVGQIATRAEKDQA